MKTTKLGFVLLTSTLLLAVGCGKVNFSQSQSTASDSPAGVPVGNGGGGTNTAPACTPTSSNIQILTSLPPGVTQAMVQAACPALGADSECGTVIIVSDSGVAVYYTGQGPYDSDDDTLVGVINNSSTLLGDIALTSNADIMGFDGDGIDAYKITGTQNLIGGNSMDTTKYGGPNAYYTNMVSGCPANDTNDRCISGTVNFVAPVAPNGGTTYFGLENSLGAASTCLSALTN